MDVLVRPMQQDDLDEADRVLRLAFGTERGLPDPMQSFGDADLIRPRWRTHPGGCLVAEAGGKIVGSVTIMDWNSVAVLGPLSVHPGFWNRGIARQLLQAALGEAAVRHAGLTGLFTNPASPRHLRLYESVGFTAQTLIAAMAKPVGPGIPCRQPVLLPHAPEKRSEALAACRQITEAILSGLDLSREIEAAEDQQLGDTILLQEAGETVGFALCHHGRGSEAGSGTLAIKFGAVRRGARSAFRDLLDAAEALASVRAARRVQASVNHARRDAYDMMKACGYRTVVSGVAMRRPDGEGYDAPDLFLLDEWR